MVIKRFEMTTRCKRIETAVSRFIRKYPNLNWIKEQEPEVGICSTEYDSWSIDTDIEGQYYIWAICYE